MTWEELKEKAKEIGGVLSESSFGTWYIKYKDLKFYWDGGITVDYSYYDSGDDENYSDSEVITSNRTPDQMWQIMEALR